jgi:sulfur carrier protein
VSNEDSTRAVEIRLNGEQRSIPPGLSLLALLEHVGVPADRVAVELNLRIVRKADWSQTLVEEGAQVEIVEFVGGG